MDQPLVGRREDVPHVAVLFVRFEVHEKLPSGELRGTAVDQGERVFKVEGADRFICVRRLNELLASLRNEQAPGQDR